MPEMRMTVDLIWDFELGPAWMNEDNLKLLLFTPATTLSSLLQVELVEIGCNFTDILGDNDG